jgi:hypothetical protein
MLRNSWVAEQLVAFQEALSSTELVSYWEAGRWSSKNKRGPTIPLVSEWVMTHSWTGERRRVYESIFECARCESYTWRNCCFPKPARHAERVYWTQLSFIFVQLLLEIFFSQRSMYTVALKIRSNTCRSSWKMVIKLVRSSWKLNFL